jgi:hypothetical protein
MPPPQHRHTPQVTPKKDWIFHVCQEQVQTVLRVNAKHEHSPAVMQKPQQ